MSAATVFRYTRQGTLHPSICRLPRHSRVHRELCPMLGPKGWADYRGSEMRAWLCAGRPGGHETSDRWALQSRQADGAKTERLYLLTRAKVKKHGRGLYYSWEKQEARVLKGKGQSSCLWHSTEHVHGHLAAFRLQCNRDTAGQGSGGAARDWGQNRVAISGRCRPATVSAWRERRGCWWLRARRTGWKRCAERGAGYSLP